MLKVSNIVENKKPIQSDLYNGLSPKMKEAVTKVFDNVNQGINADGKNKIDATLEACNVRARPIILTSVTTFLGISPLIFFATGQTKFLSPMAVSLGFGLLFATILILIVLPCFYLIMDDLKEFTNNKIKMKLKL